MADVLITRISAALADPDAPWYGSDLIEDVAAVLDRLAEVEAERDAAVTERDELRGFLDWCFDKIIDGSGFDGFDLQDEMEMERRGLIVLVPANQMFVLRWSDRASAALKEPR